MKFPLSLFLLVWALWGTSLTSQAQWIRGESAIGCNGQKGLEFKDSTDVMARLQEDGKYRIQRRVYVPRKAVMNGIIAPETPLFNEKAQEIGRTVISIPLDSARPSQVPGLRKHTVGFVSGVVRSTAFQTNSWPDRALVELLSEKHQGPFSVAFETYLQKFGWESIPASAIPDELAAAGDLKVWILRNPHERLDDPAPYRLILVSRGMTALVAVVHAQGPLSFPKIKEVRPLLSGTYHYFSKPTKSLADGLELLTYGQ